MVTETLVLVYLVALVGVLVIALVYKGRCISRRDVFCAVVPVLNVLMLCLGLMLIIEEALGRVMDAARRFFK